MAVSKIAGKTVAVCIAQPNLVLVLADGSVFEGKSEPLALNMEGKPTESVLGFTAQQPPVYTGLSRELTTDEMASDAIFVTQLSEFVPLLRAAGFRGEILTPGQVKPRTEAGGKVGAHHSTVVVLSESVQPAS